MKTVDALLMRMFGRPTGVLGRLGGHIMASMNDNAGAWVVDLLEIKPNDRVLEVGFGPGMVIRRLLDLASAGYVAGIDISEEMVRQAKARNLDAVQSGRAELRQGSVANLPFPDGSFDKALAINSMQVWADPVEGLRELRRVLKDDGQIALGFTAHSGQTPEGVTSKLRTVGFSEWRLRERDGDFCASAWKT
jgi:ubiquinone/menaquinone biosynthesis C-methylase UbiE